MEVVQHRSLEKGNVRLQEWIHEELARGEALQRQYEALQERHARLDTLLQAKRLEAVEEKNRAQQNELEETQEALQKCWSWKSQCRLHVHKQERENRRMAESVAELGEEVFEQRRKEKSSKDLLREMKMDSGRLKRHLSAWDAECKAEDERIRERCQRLEKQRATLEELSLKSQELHRNKTPLEDRTIEAELEADLFQKKSFFGQARAQFLWNDRTPDRTKRFLWQNPEGIHSKKQLPSRFIVYKLPKSHHHSPAEGMRYMYQDQQTQGWVEGKSLMDSTEGAVGRTLQQLYVEAARRRQEEETAYVLYNDEPPREFSFSKGHTKGVIFLDSTQGFWLVHSTPHFPDLQGNYSWPRSAELNGQSFLCVTFPYSQFKEIGKQLLFTDPQVYDYRVEGTFAQDLPALLNASRGCHVQQEPWNSSVTLTSVEGKEFISFAKFGLFGDDLYSGWLAEALESNLYVEFWQRSRGVLPSNCSGPFRVYNVEAVAFPEPGPVFSTMVDHSKWCVATESDPGWACVGDMNRNCAEERRGGGTLCFRDPAVWKAFYSLVKKYADCKGGGETFLGGQRITSLG